MLGNETDSAVRQRATALDGESQFFGRVLTAARTHATSFVLATDMAGFDLAAANQLQGRPNRARFKLFALSTGRLAVFFYKPSLLPFSRDRFSYGGRVLDANGVPEDEVREWLDFLAAGMPPDRRPAKLLRGFPYDVPR